MAWTSLTFAFEEVLTSTKMTQLQANFAAMAAGDSGAPEIKPAAMDADGNYTLGGIDASGTLEGQGFTDLFASPPPLGSTSPATVKTSQLRVESGTPNIWLTETDAPTDEKVIRIWSDNNIGGHISILNDAESAAKDVLKWTRTANVVDSIEVGNPTDDPDVSVYGDLVMETSSKGVDFSAAGGDILDLYEEGTYTVAATASGGGTITLDSTQDLANYIRIGNMVLAWGTILIDSVSSPTGQLLISLPVTAASSTEFENSATVPLRFRGLSAGITGLDLIGIVLVGTGTFRIEEQQDDNTSINQASIAAAGVSFVFSIMYKAG